MKKILIGLIALVSFVACDKNDDNNDNNGVQLNKYRVKTIKGSNEIWGDNYTLKVTYDSKNQIDKIYCVSNQNDTVSVISNSKDKQALVYTLNDYMLDEDGKLTKDIQTRYRVKNDITGGKIVSQEINIYSPKDVKDEEEDSNVDEYIKVSYEKLIYEYDGDGKIINCRRLLKLHNTDPAYGYYYNDEYESYVYKLRFNFGGNLVTSIDNYTSDAQIESDGNYRLLFTENLSYDNNKVISIAGGQENVSIAYSGSAVVVKKGTEKIDYTLNSEGYVTKIVNSNGNEATIEYETGHGNFSTLFSILSPVYGNVIIK